MPRCWRCNGQKRIQLIGFMEDDCPVCNGTGTSERQVKEILHVHSTDRTTADSDLAIEPLDDSPRRGRPKKEFI